MKCPHCSVAFHSNSQQNFLYRGNSPINWVYKTAHCPECEQISIDVAGPPEIGQDRVWRSIYPVGANRGPVPHEVPPDIVSDYVEACNVLPISPKASAALSRRCLQNVLHKNGYISKTLAQEIDLLLNEQDTTKAIPTTLRTVVDGIRNFGNFGSHPMTDVATTQIIDIEPSEAEWCLEIIEEMFDHFYVKPAHALARKAALDAKLLAAGKPPAK